MTLPVEENVATVDRASRGRELGKKFNAGVAWNAASKFSTRIAMFLVTIALARLLRPADFGVSSITVMVTGFLVMFAEFGFATALVQRPDITDDDICTTFSVSLLLGAGIGFLCMLASPLIADAFRTPSLAWPLRVFSLGILVSASAVTPRALLFRKVDFRSLAMADVGGSVLYGVVSIGLALAGAGVWALIAGSLTMAATGSAILYLRAGYRFRPILNRASVRSLAPFGSRVFAANIIEFLRGNLDYLVVGRVLGPMSLGLYTIAFRVADFPRSRLATLVSEVSLPTMAAVQDDQAELRIAYRRSVGTGALLTFPLLVGFTLVAPEFVRSLYGAKWEAAVPALQVLLPMGMLLAICQPGQALLLAKGKPELFLRLSALYATCVFVFSWIGSRWGITGVAWGVLAGTIPYFAGFQLMTWRHVRISPLETLRGVMVPMLGCAAMILAVTLYRQLLSARSVPGVVWLAGAGLVGGASYAVVALPLFGVKLPFGRGKQEQEARDEAESPSLDEALIEKVTSG